MKKTTILIIFLCLFQIANSQQPDTIIIKLENYGILQFTTDNLFKKDKLHRSIDSTYRHFYSDFKKIENNISFNIPKNIYYIREYQTKRLLDNSNAGEILIQPVKFENQKNQFYFLNGDIKNVPNYNVIIHLSDNLFNLSMDLTESDICIKAVNKESLEKISKLNLDSLTIMALHKLRNNNLKKKFFYKSIFELKQNQLDTSAVMIFPPKRWADDFTGTFDLGMYMINSKFIPKLDIDLNLSLLRKGYRRYNFGVGTSYLFFPNEANYYKPNTYDFFKLSFSTTSKIKNKIKGAGISIAYLMDSSGDDLKDDTWLVSFTTLRGRLSSSVGTMIHKAEPGSSNKINIVPVVGIEFGFFK